ncbi:MAG TPA: 2-iminoacetate synthase ThiH [Candidatus Onthomorpha intestinigallinarum]|uniref:2-iminoacetate synthase ThiH n=1 Tax=Candidatus Onthomorpha intestinigallinarum TaxID=2840880 RepID=A0A9D1RI47_9BACT|nr:2-iminoacetate synthase ThiH [Candidatus Onthomorpha intestinigallinarum]
MNTTFYDTIKNLEWDKVTESIYSKTERDVVSALSKPMLNIEDFKALISPAAEKFLEPMAQLSRNITRKRFGKVMQFYIPLYLSNECSNHCIYCGFNHNNPIKRITLDDEQILREIKIIKSMGYDNVLLLTGEFPRHAGVDYIEHSIELCRPYFSAINLEVFPMRVEQYERLIRAGANSVYVYQETFNEKRYKHYHPKGMKSNYAYRLGTPERLAQAGIHRVGMGALIGLEEWRTEMVYLALHLQFMTKNYWRTKYSISFPRMRPAEGGFQADFFMNEKEFAQTIWAFRIFDNNVEITMSTRETPQMRNHFVSLGVTSMSAGSKTDPGGYSKPNTELEQFHINDDRSVEEMEAMVRAQGYDVIFKDWDKILN